MAVSCAYCTSPNHVWWDCPKKPDGWRPPKPAQAIIAHVDHRKTSLTAAITKVIAENPGAFIDAAAPPIKRPRGRPKTITDMKAYKAAKERERRARLKADQSKRED